jgi:hypothetical protein
LPGGDELPEEGAVTRKPTVEELGIDLDSQKWQRSGDEDGAIEVAFIPGVAAGPGGTSWAEHAAGGPAGSAGPADRTEWVLMRVAGDPARRVLVYDRHEWECFLDGVRGGEFDEGTP